MRTKVAILQKTNIKFKLFSLLRSEERSRTRFIIYCAQTFRTLTLSNLLLTERLRRGRTIHTLMLRKAICGMNLLRFLQIGGMFE